MLTITDLALSGEKEKLSGHVLHRVAGGFDYEVRPERRLVFEARRAMVSVHIVISAQNTR